MGARASYKFSSSAHQVKGVMAFSPRPVLAAYFAPPLCFPAAMLALGCFWCLPARVSRRGDSATRPPACGAAGNKTDGRTFVANTGKHTGLLRNWGSYLSVGAVWAPRRWHHGSLFERHTAEGDTFRRDVGDYFPVCLDAWGNRRGFCWLLLPTIICHGCGCGCGMRNED